MTSNPIPSAPLGGPLVRIRTEPTGQYTAEVVGIPEIRETATTREEAVALVKLTLSKWLASGDLIRIELPPVNPVMKWFGWAKDDPSYGEFLEEIRRYREWVDEQYGRGELSSLSPFPGSNSDFGL